MPGNIIMDCDDVLVDLSTKVFDEIRANWKVFNRWFVDSGPLTVNDIQTRKAYQMSEWLLKKDFIDMTSKEYLALQLTIINEMKARIFNKDLYRTLEPTEFAKRTLMNPIYINSNTVKNVYILSRNITEKQSESKEKFIAKYFNNSKIHYIPVKFNESKADVIHNNNISWDLFVDDELPNIRDFAEKEETLKKKEFLIPKMGYNKMDKLLELLIIGKGGVFTYYDPLKFSETSKS